MFGVVPTGRTSTFGYFREWITACSRTRPGHAPDEVRAPALARGFVRGHRRLAGESCKQVGGLARGRQPLPSGLLGTDRNRRVGRAAKGQDGCRDCRHVDL